MSGTEDDDTQLTPEEKLFLSLRSEQDTGSDIQRGFSFRAQQYLDVLNDHIDTTVDAKTAITERKETLTDMIQTLDQQSTAWTVYGQVQEKIGSGETQPDSWNNASPRFKRLLKFESEGNAYLARETAGKLKELAEEYKKLLKEAGVDSEAEQMSSGERQ